MLFDYEPGILRHALLEKSKTVQDSSGDWVRYSENLWQFFWQTDAKTDANIQKAI